MGDFLLYSSMYVPNFLQLPSMFLKIRGEKNPTCSSKASGMSCKLMIRSQSAGWRAGSFGRQERKTTSMSIYGEHVKDSALQKWSDRTATKW